MTKWMHARSYAAAQMHARSSVINPDITECRTAVARVSEGVNVTYSVCCGSCVQCELAAAQRRHCSSFFLHRQRQWDERASERNIWRQLRHSSAALGSVRLRRRKGERLNVCIVHSHSTQLLIYYNRPYAVLLLLLEVVVEVVVVSSNESLF